MSVALVLTADKVAPVHAVVQAAGVSDAICAAAAMPLLTLAPATAEMPLMGRPRSSGAWSEPLTNEIVAAAPVAFTRTVREAPRCQTASGESSTTILATVVAVTPVLSVTQ